MYNIQYFNSQKLLIIFNNTHTEKVNLFEDVCSRNDVLLKVDLLTQSPSVNRTNLLNEKKTPSKREIISPLHCPVLDTFIVFFYLFPSIGSPDKCGHIQARHVPAFLEPRLSGGPVAAAPQLAHSPAHVFAMCILPLHDNLLLVSPRDRQNLKLVRCPFAALQNPPWCLLLHG